jgi:CheY-like chemotaxis protein
MQVLDSVLLVDDDEAANFFHKSLIKKLGIAREIIETKDGREAFNFIEQNYHSLKQLPSLVLVDIAMPKMNGIELIQELKNSELLAVNKIPIAVVSVSTSEKDQNAIRELGNFPYVTKTLNDVKFFDILQSVVVPSLVSNQKRTYINEMQRDLEQQLEYLKQQREWLKERQKEIVKYTEQVREKIKKLRGE